MRMAVLGLALSALIACERAPPAPAALPPDMPSPLPVNVERFTCPNGDTLEAAFQAMPDLATVTVGESVLRLPIAVSGSGFRYAENGVEFTGKGDEVRLVRPGQTDLICTRALPPPP